MTNPAELQKRLREQPCMPFRGMESQSLSRVAFGIVRDDPRLTLSDITSPPAASLKNCSFFAADLRGADLRHVDAPFADFRQTRLEGADFARANLGLTKFDEQELDEGFFAGACLDGASLRAGRFRRSVFVKASLLYADLTDADLCQANFSEARLQGCRLVRAHLEGASLCNAHLEPPDDGDPVDGAMLNGAYLDDATNLSGTVIARKNDGAAAWLGRVRWNGADVTAIDWSGVRFLGEEANVRDARSLRDRPLDQVDYTVAGVFVNRKTPSDRADDTREAMMATRQISALLRAQGMRAPADAFAYRGHLMERRLLRQQKQYLAAAGSWLLDLLTGYSFRPSRIIAWYALVVFAWALFYYTRAGGVLVPFNLPLFGDALSASVAAMLGRGAMLDALFAGSGATLAAVLQGVLGLFFEVTLIVAFTQRAFGR